MLSRKQTILLSSVAAVALGAGVFWKMQPPKVPRPHSVQSVMPAELLGAIAEAKQKPGEKPGEKPAAMVAKNAPQQEMTFERTGTNALQLKVTNATRQPSGVSLAAGTVFEDEKSEVILLKAFDAKVPAGGNLAQELAVIALSSENQGGRGSFKSSSKTRPKLAPLIQHLESHSNVPVNVVQTAALAILEDAPVDVFARFPRLKSMGIPEDAPFKADTCDIIAAIQLLREIGMDSSRLAQDPQLKIEAMIDLKAHEAAMQYYGITASTEWNYWKHELTEGDPSTRHYALYGIARFYPDVAMQMMPKWALEARVSPHYRRAAIGALGLTQKSEAKSLLHALERELAPENELAQRVEPSLRYLEQNLTDAL